MLRDHYALGIPFGQRNPIIDVVVPGLLLIKAVSILQDALRVEIGRKNLPTPSKYRSTLEDDINLLTNEGVLATERISLHKIRDRRGDSAHQATQNMKWPELSVDIDTIETAMQKIDTVEMRPKIEIYSERSAAAAAKDPRYVISFRHIYGVTVEGVLGNHFEWITHHGEREAPKVDAQSPTAPDSNQT